MTWFLMLIVSQNTAGGLLRYSAQPMTFEECQKSAKTFNAKIPSGGDAETVIAVVCSKGKLEYVK